MHKILITGEKFTGKLLFELDDTGTVRQFTNEAELNEAQVVWLSTHFPMTLDKINQLSREGAIKAELIDTDLSFNSFWDKYDLKVGRQEAMRFWGKLSKADKLLAIQNIDPYNYYITVKSIAKMYPATYLNPRNRKFETDYKALVKAA